MCLRLCCRTAGNDWRENADVSAHGAGAIFLQDNVTVCRTVKCHEGAVIQNIIKDVCNQLGIPPMARVFFALCSRGNGLPLNPYCTLSKRESRAQYQLRVFVNIANSWYLKQISAVAYDYYYQQLCSDFVNGHLQPYVTINSAVWMSAITMAKEANACGKTFDKLMSNGGRYMPKVLHRRYKKDGKISKKLKEIFEQFHKLNADNSHYISKFLEVYEKDKMCGHHLFPLKRSSRISFLTIETEHVVISWKDGIYKVVIGDQKTNHELLCTLAEISTITADFTSCQLSINRADKREAHLSFTSVKDLVGFSVITQAYWRLKVDGSHSVFRGDIVPPDHSPICHAPITEDATELILKEHFSEGNFLVRESKTIDNAYTLSLCYNKQILRYRIVCDSDGTYSLNNKSKVDEHNCQIVHTKFSTLHDLIYSHQKYADGLPTLLRLNITPDVAGQVPLLPSWSYPEPEPTQPAMASTVAVTLPSSDVPQGIMWSRSLAGLRCRCCQQKCGNEFVHLCNDCDHNYCIHCVRDLPRTRWLCYDCKPILQVLPREQLLYTQLQHDDHTEVDCKFNGGKTKTEGKKGAA